MKIKKGNKMITKQFNDPKLKMNDEDWEYIYLQIDQKTYFKDLKDEDLIYDQLYYSNEVDFDDE